MWLRKAEYRLIDNTEDEQKGFATISFSEEGSILEVNERPWDPENKPQKIYFDWKDFEHLAEAIVNSEFRV